MFYSKEIYNNKNSYILSLYKLIVSCFSWMLFVHFYNVLGLWWPAVKGGGKWNIENRNIWDPKDFSSQKMIWNHIITVNCNDDQCDMIYRYYECITLLNYVNDIYLMLTIISIIYLHFLSIMVVKYVFN